MIFGEVATHEAAGTILAHSHKLATGRLKKGTRLSREDVASLRAGGFTRVVVARLEAGDMGEDEAAQAIGDALGCEGLHTARAATGRANLYTDVMGLFLPDRALVDAVNAVDPGITLATRGEYEMLAAGTMAATVKIIPLAVDGRKVGEVVELLKAGAAFSLAPARAKRVALVQTQLDTVKPTVLDKTRQITEARLAPSGSLIVEERRCAHDAAALTQTLRDLRPRDLTLIFGASAIIDPQDVVPGAIRRAGGAVEHLGMPVDPGNLLLLGSLDGQPLVGAPGCARSPKENGFDWVLDRLVADLPIGASDIRSMGVGGLLTEIASRPEPREAASATDRGAGSISVDVVVLAAGRSSRMGNAHKLLARFDGVPLVRRSVETALKAGRARRVRVVVGHRHDEIAAALEGLDVEIVLNPAYADGLSTSLKKGFRASIADARETESGATREPGADGVLVMLADQPFVEARHLDALVEMFEPRGAGSIVAAFDGRKRRNPVILSRVYASEIERIAGDIGAQAVIAAHPEAVVEVDIGEAASFDVDTPDAMAKAGGSFRDPA